MMISSRRLKDKGIDIYNTTRKACPSLPHRRRSEKTTATLSAGP